MDEYAKDRTLVALFHLVSSLAVARSASFSRGLYNPGIKRFADDEYGTLILTRSRLATYSREERCAIEDVECYSRLDLEGIGSKSVG
jgi:hypothetical protein